MTDINDIIARVRDRLDGWDPERMSFMADDIRALLDEIERLHMAGRADVLIAERNKAEREIAGTRADAWSERTARIATQASLREAVEVMRKCLNYIENTESCLGIMLGCGDAARAFLAKMEKTDG